MIAEEIARQFALCSKTFEVKELVGRCLVALDCTEFLFVARTHATLAHSINTIFGAVEDPQVMTQLDGLIHSGVWPFTEIFQSRAMPARWQMSTLFERAHETGKPGIQSFIGRLADTGVSDGLTVFTRMLGNQRAALTVLSKGPLSGADLMPQLMFISLAAANAVKRIGESKYERKDFTPKELDVTPYIVAGCNLKEIARQQNISLSTVQYHVANISKKLGVRGQRRAVARLLDLGYAIDMSLVEEALARSTEPAPLDVMATAGPAALGVAVQGDLLLASSLEP